MKPFVVCVVVAVVSVLGSIGAPAAYGQLYGDGKSVTKGDLNDQDYWWARYDDMMLDLALKTHQPEGQVALQLASMTRRLDELSARFPKHEDVQKMRQHAEEVGKAINPDTGRGAGFGPGCPWEESNFAQIWVNLHWAKVSWDQKDYTNVERLLQNINQNLGIMLAPDRMKDYPADLSAYVRDAKPEAEKLAKMLNGPHTPAAGGAEIKPDPIIIKDPLNEQDYWWARYDDMMLDYAIRERQPEGHIDYMLAGAIKRLDELLAKHPEHEGLKKMQKHAADVQAKIDPKADRNIPFATEVPWEEVNFAQLWVNLHHASLAHSQNDDATASGLLSNIRQNQGILLAPDRMKSYPAALKKWVEDSKAESEKLAKEIKAKKGR